jgi:anti-sigma factor RsiW
MGEMMECKQGEEITALMSLALDDLLDGEGQRRLEGHLATCPTCRAEWAAMQQVSALFEGASLVGPPLGFAIRVERRLAEDTRKRRRRLGGVAMLTGSLSLAGVTVAAVLLIVFGVLAWQWLGTQPAVQQGTGAISHVASGLGLVGKGASFFLGDLLLHYGLPLLILLGVGLALLSGVWAWLFVKRPGNSHRNGYV